MKIYVVGNSKNKFLPLDNIREKFLIDQKHEGDNIDFLNPWYCELTGLYYLWKHVDDDIVGLEHYRNYFYNNSLLDKTTILKLLKDNDIICGSVKTPLKLKEELHILTQGDDETFLEILKRQYPEFHNFLISYLERKRFYWCNCFIGKKEVIEKWSDFIFNLLIDFEQEKDLHKSPLRREGFFAEYLFGAWLEFNHYKVIHQKMSKFSKDLQFIERIADI